MVGAGLGGFQYDIQAAYNGTIDDKGWGISIGFGAAIGFLTGGLGELKNTGEFRYVGGKLSKVADKVGLKVLVGKVGASIGLGSRVGVLEQSVGRKIVNELGARFVATAKLAPKTIGISVAGRIGVNAKDHKDVFEGIGEAALVGLGLALAGGFASRLPGLPINNVELTNFTPGQEIEMTPMSMTRSVGTRSVETRMSETMSRTRSGMRSSTRLNSLMEGQSGLF